MNERAEQFTDLYVRGLKLLEEGKEQAGTALLYQAAKLAPDGWLALAVKLVKDGQHEQAMARLNEVLRLTKVDKIKAAALNNIGMILAHRGQNGEALAKFQEASRLAPEFPDTWSNMALCSKWRGDLDGCIRLTDRALLKDPWHEQAQFIRAMALLLKGDYLRGFEEYECRWRSKGNGLAKIVADCPEWDGTNGKRVFVYGEQGQGDSILLLRYARLLRERGIHQTWVIQKPLFELAKTIPEIDSVVMPGTPFNDYDCHIPAASLPRVLKTTIDNIPSAPYLAKPKAFDHGPGFHVGIAWRGSKTQNNDNIRSTKLADWLPLLNVPHGTFWNLQVDEGDESLLYPLIRQYPNPPADFLETSSRVSGLDLVISVDTSIVHLCGAMGIPVWCALHCRPYFVYPPYLPESTPWYSSVKLYRQQREFQWQPVFERMAEDLCKMAS